MAKYGKFDTFDELLDSYKPMMEEDKKVHEQTKSKETRKSKYHNYDTKDDMMVLLYALEHMSDEEVDALAQQCAKDLEEEKTKK